MSTLRITYRKSAIGYARDQKATIAALGLRRLHQTVELPDTPALRGMVHKVRHLVSVEGVPADSPEGVALLAARPVSSGAAAVLTAGGSAQGAVDETAVDEAVAPETGVDVSTESAVATPRRRPTAQVAPSTSAEAEARKSGERGRGTRRSAATREEADRG